MFQESIKLDSKMNVALILKKLSCLVGVCVAFIIPKCGLPLFVRLMLPEIQGVPRNMTVGQ